MLLKCYRGNILSIIKANTTYDNKKLKIIAEKLFFMLPLRQLENYLLLIKNFTKVRGNISLYI